MLSQARDQSAGNNSQGSIAAAATALLSPPPSAPPLKQDGANILACFAAVGAVHELTSTLGASDPQTIGSRLLDECTSGRILPGLTATAAHLELGSVSLASASLHIPTHEELRRHNPPLYEHEASIRLEMRRNDEAIEEAGQQVEAQRQANTHTLHPVTPHPPLPSLA